MRGPAAPVPPFRAVVWIDPPPASVPASRPLPPPSRPLLPEGTRIGLLSATECFAELDRAAVRYQRLAAPVPGIAIPIRLAGPVGGVLYRGSARSEDAVTTLLDCRLARVLVEFSAILRALGVVEVVHYSMHRPGTKGRPVGEGGRTGHNGGLAIDAASFRRVDGTWLNIFKQFRGRRRAPVCGPTAAAGPTPAARVLRDIVCRADEQRLFHVVLTPNHDRAHRNHYHLEVRPDGVRWFVLH